MEQEELTVVDEILQNYNVSVLKDTKSIKEIKVLNNNRSSTRDAIENALYAAKIPFGALTRDVGSFGGTEFNFDQKKVAQKDQQLAKQLKFLSLAHLESNRSKLLPINHPKSYI